MAPANIRISLRILALGYFLLCISLFVSRMATVAFDARYLFPDSLAMDRSRVVSGGTFYHRGDCVVAIFTAHSFTIATFHNSEIPDRIHHSSVYFEFNLI